MPVATTAPKGAILGAAKRFQRSERRANLKQIGEFPAGVEAHGVQEAEGRQSLVRNKALSRQHRGKERTAARSGLRGVQGERG